MGKTILALRMWGGEKNTERIVRKRKKKRERDTCSQGEGEGPRTSA